MASGSSTLVRKASLPSFVQPIHVPPPRTSLPPRIFFEPSPHHPTALVGLHQFVRAKSAHSIHQEQHRQSATWMIKQRRRPEGKGDQAEEEPTESLTRLHYCLQAGTAARQHLKTGRGMPDIHKQ
uniref:Uncharacterized protein n=2 Tax=Oryza rufipogon TaxID=4529 RepID=A0A0E0QPR6_ORYRU